MARLQVGDFAYLQNFRKGLRQQRERSLREFAEATQAGDVATVARFNRPCSPMMTNKSRGFENITFC